MKSTLKENIIIAYFDKDTDRNHHKKLGRDKKTCFLATLLYLCREFFKKLSSKH